MPFTGKLNRVSTVYQNVTYAKAFCIDKISHYSTDDDEIAKLVYKYCIHNVFIFSDSLRRMENAQ